MKTEAGWKRLAGIPLFFAQRLPGNSLANGILVIFELFFNILTFLCIRLMHMGLCFNQRVQVQMCVYTHTYLSLCNNVSKKLGMINFL